MDRFRGKKLREEEDFVLNNVYESIKKIFTVNGKMRFLLIAIVFVLTNLMLIIIQFWFPLWTDNEFELDNNHSFIIALVIFGLLVALVVFKDYIWTSILLGNLSKIYDDSVRHLLGAKKEWID